VTDEIHADTICLVSYAPSWPSLFEREAELLRGSLPLTLACQIEHFGSTAVPGLTAKPVIDILLMVPERARWPELVPLIENLGYDYWRDNPAPDEQLYVKGRPPLGTGRTHHIHVRLPSAARRELRFRDLLRGNQELREAYARLKQELAQQYRLDREAYTHGKTGFIDKALREC